MKKSTVSPKAQTVAVKKKATIKPATPAKGCIIPAAKAARIRKEVMKLDPQYSQFLDTAVTGKKELDNAKETIKNKLDSMSEMGEMESLRLQMAMDRLSKLMSTLSNMLKKISDTASAITQNIK